MLLDAAEKEVGKISSGHRFNGDTIVVRAREDTRAAIDYLDGIGKFNDVLQEGYGLNLGTPEHNQLFRARSLIELTRENARGGFSLALDAVPIIGTVKSGTQIATGTDVFTGKPVNRIIEGGLIAASVFPFGKLAGQAATKYALAIGRFGKAAERGGGRTIAEFGACFVAGTLVHTPYGLKPIEQLRAGDLVLSQPEMGGEQASRPIVKTVSFDDKAIWQISYVSADGQAEAIRATDNHPFWVEGIGWTAAELLEAGQTLQLASGSAASVVSAFDTGTVDQVFNFEVDGFHTYYVGQQGVWAHNTNCAAGELGRAGELVSSELTGLAKNTSRIPSASSQRTFRVPDHLEPLDLRYIAETKNVSRQSLTSQILDDAAFVTRGGRPGRVDVIIDSRTTITGPLLRAHLNPGSPIKIIQTNLNRTGN